jgi:hypothetical protein
LKRSKEEVPRYDNWATHVEPMTVTGSSATGRNEVIDEMRWEGRSAGYTTYTRLDEVEMGQD